jgi:unsaturated rhamnogalacturonyl hydrolase
MPVNSNTIGSRSALDYAMLGADTLMRKFTVDKLPPENHFHYHQGVFLSGMERTYFLSKEKRFYDYIKAWADYYIDENGKIRYCDIKQFDDMMPAILLFNLYKETGDIRYKAILDSFIPMVEKWPTNVQGGFWHKFEHENQMWLDGLYMIGPYHVMYAHTFNTKPYFYDRVYHQLNLMRRNMTDPKTGLLYHACDDSKEINWADKNTGLSPNFWGRAMGWYVVAIMDILDYLPPAYPHRDDFIAAEYDILNALIRFQDDSSGMWYQVVDRGDDERNWLETSCTCLYTYAIAKAIKRGLLHKNWWRYVEKAYRGVIQNSITLEGEGLVVSNVCMGTNVGEYEFYLDRPRIANDLHGMGAFLLMCTEVYDTAQALGLSISD